MVEHLVTQTPHSDLPLLLGLAHRQIAGIQIEAAVFP
jgi:hypothetical protein